MDEAVTRGIAEFGKMDILISTEADMIEGGYQFPALKGMTFMPPQVIADTALYLNSDLAAAVTGVTTPVDPGHMLLPGMNRPRRRDAHQRSIRPGRKLDEEEPWQDE